MPKDKSNTLEKIIPSAKKEFLEKGFAGTSMRSIAAGAGMSAAGLYRHFESKEALFDALVSPVYTEFLSIYRAQSDRFFSQLEAAGLDPMWESSQQTMSMFMEYLYDHIDEFRLLISCSEQTTYEHFTHSLVDLEVDMTVSYIEKAREMGFAMKPANREEIHVLANAHFSCVFEMILHNVPKAKAMKMTDRFSAFFAAGWKEYMLEQKNT